MPIKVSLALLSLIILAGMLFGAARLYSLATTEHDGWDIFAPVDVTTEPLTVEPRNLLIADHREDLDHVVREARTYGIPWSILVVSREEVDEDLTAAEIAAERFDEQPVETTEDAGDGLLMVVVVSQPDHSDTEVEFVTGPNFYPRGGITPDRLEYIADVQMAPLIAENSIGEAVIEGATWVEWTQLFQPTPDTPPTSLEQGLQDLLSPAGAAIIAAIALVVLAAAALVKLITWRGTMSPARSDLNGLLAAAAARGRVDHHVVSGVILDAVDRGALAVANQRVTATTPRAASQWDAHLRAAVAELEEQGIAATPALLSQRAEETGELGRDIEDQLAETGIYHPKSPVFTFGLRWIAVTGLVLGLVALVLSVIGESAPALVAGIALTAVSLVVLIWNGRRTWTTRSGHRAVAQWLAAHGAPDDRARMLYETIMGLETVDLLPPYHSPVRQEAQPLVGALHR